MGTSRIRRIGSREAEQLLTADSNGSAYPELSHLLGAAAAPPRPDELVQLRVAVAAFEAAGRGGDRGTAVAGRRRVFARSVVMKAVAGVAVVLFGGTALAAETGNLPGAAQQHAHDVFSGLGVPPPGTAPASTGPSAGPGSPSASRSPSPSPTPSGKAETSRPASPAVLGLCRSWRARAQNPANKPVKGEALRVLTAAAGGTEHIATFCAGVLGDGQGETPAGAPSTEPATATPAPSHPGKAKGHDHTQPTPNPHKNG